MLPLRKVLFPAFVFLQHCNTIGFACGHADVDKETNAKEVQDVHGDDIDIVVIKVVLGLCWCM